MRKCVRAGEKSAPEEKEQAGERREETKDGTASALLSPLFLWTG